MKSLDMAPEIQTFASNLFLQIYESITFDFGEFE